MRTIVRLVPTLGFAALLLGGCVADGRHGRMGVSVSTGNYYEGYYDGSYGTFNDGYWGNDGAFYYSDSSNAWHRDDGNHFRRDHGDGDSWNQIHGSGAHRDH